MQIKVAKPDLEAALQVASIGLTGSGSDLSTHFVFRRRDGAVEILAGVGHICSSSTLKCECDGEDGDAMTIEGWRLQRWLGGVGDAPLTFTADGAEVQAKSPRSTITLKSLDPTKFPYWDKTLGEAKSIATMKAERLSSALGYAKHFISDTDTTKPTIAQTEILGGSLWATDKKAVTFIALDGLTDSGLRIHGKDIASVQKFLSLKETDEVEVLEHDRSLFLRRHDGAVVGAARPLAQFPTLNVGKDAKDQAMWEVKTEDLLAGFQCLSAAAEKDNTSLRFAFDKDTEKVVMSVRSASGKVNEYPIECLEHSGDDQLPDNGFELDYPYISHIVGHFGGETLKFGVNQKGKGGYVQFRHEVEKDSFVTVVVWKL